MTEIDERQRAEARRLEFSDAERTLRAELRLALDRFELATGERADAVCKVGGELPRNIKQGDAARAHWWAYYRERSARLIYDARVDEFRCALLAKPAVTLEQAATPPALVEAAQHLSRCRIDLADAIARCDELFGSDDEGEQS